MDELYATQSLFKWLNENKIRFEVRVHSNRVIEHKSKRHSLRKYHALQLKENRKHKIIQAIIRH